MTADNLRSGVSEELYVQLTGMATGLLNQLVQVSPCAEADFLEFVSRAEHYVQERAKRTHNALSYFNRYWVRREITEGRKIVDIFELHRTLLSTTFLANVQDKVRASAFKFILNGGSLNCWALQRSLIRDLISSRQRVSQTFLPTFSLRRRPIYLLSRRLEQLVSTSLPTEQCSRANELLPCPPEVSQTQRRGSSVFATWMATFDHWGLLIGPSDTDGLELVLCADGDSHVKTSASGLLCELQALHEDDGYISAFVGAPEGRSFDNRSLCLLKGYTSCSDGQIRNYGEFPLPHKDSGPPKIVLVC